MKNHLVTFSAPGGQYGTVYGSHVLLMARVPQTQREWQEVQMILSMEPAYTGLDIRHQIVSELPYQDSAHQGDGLYGYYLMYAIMSPPSGSGSGHMTYARSQPILTLDDVREVERRLAAGRKNTYARLTSCTKLQLTSDERARIDWIDE